MATLLIHPSPSNGYGRLLDKQKFFFWLLLVDRLNTRELLTRKNFYVETSRHLIHLFFSCDFSQNFWMSIGIEWNTDTKTIDMLEEAKERSNIQPFKECLIVGCWSIRKHRNSIIFDRKAKKNLEYCITCFKEHLGTIMKKAKPSTKEGMQSWLDYLRM